MPNEIGVNFIDLTLVGLIDPLSQTEMKQSSVLDRFRGKKFTAFPSGCTVWFQVWLVHDLCSICAFVYVVVLSLPRQYLVT